MICRPGILWSDVITESSEHQSVKKAGVQAPVTHVSIDEGSGESDDDVIEQSMEEPSIVTASLVVGSLIIVPLTAALTITVCARLYRQGYTFTISTDVLLRLACLLFRTRIFFLL